MMRLKNISADARPQVRTLLFCAAATIALWYIPFLSILSYPFNLFVTFIHEGGHALAALLTGNSVASLSVATDASGLTYTTTSGILSQVIVSSAGYLGAMAYGALLLILIRRSIAARYVLIGSAALVLALTLIYGLGSLFTIVAGVCIAAGLVAVARFASPRTATFFVSFLAVQSVLNALLDLKTLFFYSFVPGSHSDAGNMAQATGIPALFWSVVWIALAFVILSLAMRAYSNSRERRANQQDLPFEETVGV
ncbi:MAG TPA: M50 family metallopeptidase [Pyrinomonadaceae bacterium]|nr:M50 family metallopeptidase [Pyrinomonadaceae bacterium]